MNTFPSKIFLLGEYSILLGSMGLAVPYLPFRGRLEQPSQDMLQEDEEFSRQSNRHLRFLLEYLTSDTEKSDCLDLCQLRNEVSKGLFFRSNIPQGYGVGSSGALTAAIFDRYAYPDCKKSDPAGIRRKLSKIEMLFHGTSSGLDPMVSYTKATVLVGEDGTIETPGVEPEKLFSDYGIFLIDTCSSSSTSGLVNWFREQLKDPVYHRKFHQNYIPLVNFSIRAIIGNKKDAFFSALSEISAFQLEHFTPMIPAPFLEYFREGLSSGNHFLKLCGSGGGGYLLGFSADPAQTREWTRERNLSAIFL